MARLVFKNKNLLGILKITEQSKVFRRSYKEAIEAYERETKKEYDRSVDLSRFYEHNKPTLWFVKDEGISLMTSAKMEELPDDKSHVCYAEGFEPDRPDCYELCEAAVGGDDFVEFFDFTEQLREGIKKGADIEVYVTHHHFTLHIVFPRY